MMFNTFRIIVWVIVIALSALGAFLIYKRALPLAVLAINLALVGYLFLNKTNGLK